MENNCTPDVRLMVKITKPFPETIEELEEERVHWEKENNRNSSLTDFLRHQYTNYDKLCKIIPYMIPLSENPTKNEEGVWYKQYEEAYLNLKYWASYIVREELIRKYGLDINPHPHTS